MKIIIILQARMTSSRLPGKVLKEVLGKPLLEYQAERLKCVKLASNTVIATTVKRTDYPVVKLCQKLNMPFFRGSEEDVLERFFLAAKEYNADAIVRVTGDCPLIDPVIVDKVIQFYLSNFNYYDYVSNTMIRTYPRGMDAEIFSYELLKEAHKEALEQTEREHVTPFFYRRPDRFNLANVKCEEDYSFYRLTVDTHEDYILIKKIIEALYPVKPFFKLHDCLDLLINNPEWKKINEHIEQKQI